MLRLTLAAAAASLALTGCLGGAEREGAGTRATAAAAAPAEAPPRSGFVEVVAGSLSSRPPHVLGRLLYELEGAAPGARLAARVNAAFVGTFGPPALAADGVVLYHAFSEGTPVLRLHDLDQGRDRVLVRGASSFALRGDGALAYVEGRYREPAAQGFVGHVVVRPSLRAKPLRWTRSEAHYVAAAWAGRTLLVHRFAGGRSDVLAFDRPGGRRVLARRAFFVALSPDGTRAVVADQSTPPAVRVVDVETGRELARYAFGAEQDPLDGQPVLYVGGSGSWAGELIVAPASGGLAVFRADERELELELEQMLYFDPRDFPSGIWEPRTDGDGRHIVAWGEITIGAPPSLSQAAAEAAILECDRLLLRCVEGRRGQLHYAPPRPLYDPSRP